MSDDDLREELSSPLKEIGAYYIGDNTNWKEVQEDIIHKSLTGYKRELRIFINSQGGCVDQCWALIDILQYINIPIRTIGLGCCASAAASLLACGDVRQVMPHTAIMIHGCSGGGVDGPLQAFESRTKMMRDEFKKDLNFWLKHSGAKKRQIETWLNGHEHWFTAEEALSLGLVDEILRK